MGEKRLGQRERKLFGMVYSEETKKVKLNINLKIYHKTRALNSQLNRDCKSAVESLWFITRLGRRLYQFNLWLRTCWESNMSGRIWPNSWGNPTWHVFVLKVRRGTFWVIPHPSRRIQADWAWPHDREEYVARRMTAALCLLVGAVSYSCPTLDSWLGPKKAGQKSMWDVNKECQRENLQACVAQATMLGDPSHSKHKEKRFPSI